MDIKKTCKKWLRRTLYVCYLGVVSLVLFEWMYRWQIVDTYRTEFAFFNPPSACNPHKKNILIFGDSFSVPPNSYTSVLRDSNPDANYINCALPGTGIAQACIVAPKRMKAYPPDALIYQIYVGNDLHDIRKQSFTGKLPFLKDVFYFMTNYFRSLAYLNYQLGQFAYFREWKSQQGILKPAADSEKIDTFSVEKYAPYERQLLYNEPLLLENTILQKGDRQKDMERLVSGIRELIRQTKQDTIPVYLIVIPHCTQINAYYRQKYQQIGISLPSDPSFQQAAYPFVTALQTQFATSPNIRVIDLLPALQQSDSTKHRLFYENDFHLTPMGHQVCAKVVRSAL